MWYPYEVAPLTSFPKLKPATLVGRDNRFRATVWLEGVETKAHIPNSGRLCELLTFRASVWLTHRSQAGRRTLYDLVLVESHGALVCIDARLPPALIAEAWRAKRLPAFSDYNQIRFEVVQGASRFDLRFENSSGALCWVETKCVTLVQEGVARFPDAPTERGRRHLQHLTHLVRQGTAGAVIFVVQRSDAHAFSPHDATDPAFGQALRQAATAGVHILAYACRVSVEGIELRGDSLPIIL